ncbi:MAG: hypothetical protein MAG715_00387 [Methanonatronarchaeales archaeon]|nr:hypothetical protein [Methanonatronarchaeales archaeon]
MSRALEAMGIIARSVEKVSRDIDEEEVEGFVDSLLEAESVFLMGAGRSGLVARAFAMRLMHLGFSVHVVGETTTPLHGENDLVVAISGSGETSSVAEMGEIVEESSGTELALVTGSRSSTIGRLADHVVELPGLDELEERLGVEDISAYAPLGTLFEETVFGFLDGVVSRLMERQGQTEKDLALRHAALE